jgi:hypothetical protein
LSEQSCYEPVVIGLGGGRFVAAWEEEGRVRARLVPGVAPALTLSGAEAGQATLAAGAGKIYAAWAEQAGRFRRIVVGHLALDESGLALKSVHPVESREPLDEQAWPALAVAGDGSLAVVWEDRRHKHTVPMSSHSAGRRGFLAAGAPQRSSKRQRARTRCRGRRDAADPDIVGGKWRGGGLARQTRFPFRL